MTPNYNSFGQMIESLGEKRVMAIVNLHFEREAKRKEYNAIRNEDPDVIAKRKAYQAKRNADIKLALAILKEREGKQ